MTNTQLTPGQIGAAFAVALAVDCLQVPLIALSFTGFLTIPVEFLDLCVDVGTCVALSYILGGFHWVLAPALVGELLPFVDILPTWTASVAVVVLLKGKRPAKAGAVTNERSELLAEPTRRRDIEVLSRAGDEGSER